MSDNSIERMLNPLIREAQKKGSKHIILRGNTFHNKDVVRVAKTMNGVSEAKETELAGTMGLSVIIDIERPAEVEVSYDNGKTWSKTGSSA